MDLHFLVAHRTAEAAKDTESRGSSPQLTYAAYLATGETFAKQAQLPTQAIGPFCYPLGRKEAELPAEQSARLKYTFTLTDGQGKSLHGFCRRSPAPASADSADALPVRTHQPCPSALVQVAVHCAAMC
jgi:hypothetical protein